MRTITQAEYMRMLNEEGADFCDCCGDKVLIEGLTDGVTMPDFSETDSDGSHPMRGGFTVCYQCGEHCDPQQRKREQR